MIKTKQAFTLVELIVVIIILSILGTIAFISLQGYSKSSRDSVRISDVSNMKTSLELFHLHSGKYPLPDNGAEVSYSGDILWTQGTFGTKVVSQLSRNLSKIPTDPLTDKQYIYSVVNNRNEFEILTLLESDIALNTIPQTNAATLMVTPRVDGKYNGIFLKTLNYIVPTPSIITSEEIGGGLVLTNTNIKSQITTGGKNIPNYGNINYNTGGLTGIELSVTPAINSKSTDIEKLAVITAIQNAYTGSSLTSDYAINNILSKTSDEDKLSFIEYVVLENKNITSPSQIPEETEDEELVIIDYTVDQCEGGTPSSNAEYFGYKPISSAFDNENGDYADPNVDTNNTWQGYGVSNYPIYVQYDFGDSNDKQIQKYTLTRALNDAGYPPDEWEFQGSNDNSTRTPLDSQSGISDWSLGATKSWTFDNSNNYRYYRFSFTKALNSAYITVVIGEIEMMEAIYN